MQSLLPLAEHLSNRPRYRVFGLTVEANEPLIGLRSVVSDAAPDLSIEFGPLPARAPEEDSAEPWHVSPFLDEQQRPMMTAWLAGEGHFFHLKYADGAEFLIDRGGRRICVDYRAHLTPAEAASYLLGPILALSLRLMRVVCLHASAVEVDGRAVLFLGPSHSGKSTIAAWLASKGHGVLADEVVALDRRDGGFMARPAYPWLRLLRASAEAMTGVLQPAPSLRSVWDDDYLDLELGQPGYRFVTVPLPIGAIYLIDKGDDASTAPPLPPSRAIVGLLKNTWGARLMDRDRRAEEFSLLTALSSSVTIHRLPWSGQFRDLPSIRDRVLAHNARWRIPAARS